MYFGHVDKYKHLNYLANKPYTNTFILLIILVAQYLLINITEICQTLDNFQIITEFDDPCKNLFTFIPL